MQKMKLISLASIIILIFTVSCSNSPEPSESDINPVYLHGGHTKSWVLDEVYDKDSNLVEVDECYKDHRLIFNFDGTGIFVYGENRCDTSSRTYTDNFTWVTDGNLLQLRDFDGKANFNLNIDLTHPQYLYVSGIFELNGNEVKLQQRYNVEAIRDNDVSLPVSYATNNQTKIWELVSLTKGGVTELRECEDNNKLIMNVDGSGYFVKNEDPCPGDITGNDFINWQLIGNDDLEFSNISLQGFVSQQTAEVIELNRNVLNFTLQYYDTLSQDYQTWEFLYNSFE
jgi:hypothetical protein